MALTYVPAGRVPASDFTTKQDDEALYWKRLQQLSVFQEPGPVTSVTFSPNKPYTVATTSSVRLSFYDTVIYEPLNMFSRFKQAVYGARFRRDGKLIAVGGEEGKLRVFDAESSSGTGKAPLRSLKTSSQSLKVVDFSRNGKTIFSLADDGIIKQWDLGDIGSVPKVEIAAHKDAIRAGVASGNNENIIVSGGYDHKVKLWDLRNINSNKPSIEIDVDAPVEDILFLPSENLLATASTNVVKIWDMSAGGRQLASIQQHHKTVTSLSLCGRGKYLLSGAIDRRVNVFNITDFTLTHSMSMAAPVLGLAISPDDMMMAVGMGNLLAIHRRSAMKEVITATSYQSKTSVIINRNATVEVKERGEEKKKVELSAMPRFSVKLHKVDLMLKKYKHAAALRAVFNKFNIRERREQIVGWLTVIVHRGAIRPALAGQANPTIICILKFLLENLIRNNYFEILRHVAEALFEVYSEEEIDPYIIKLMLRLKDCVSRELTVQKQILQTIGIIEMLLNSSKTIENDIADDFTGVFGDVTVTALPLPSDITVS